MVPQFLLKALHAILAVRVPRSPAPAPSPAALRRRDRWFHLPLQRRPRRSACRSLPRGSRSWWTCTSPPRAAVAGARRRLSSSGGRSRARPGRRRPAGRAWPSTGRTSAASRFCGRSTQRCASSRRTARSARYPPHPASSTTTRWATASGPSPRPSHAPRRPPCAPAVSVPSRPSSGASSYPYSTSPASPPSISRSPPSRQPRSSLITSAAPQPSPRAPSRPRSRRQPARPFRRPRGARTAGRRLWPHSPGQQAKFSPPPAHYASLTPSPPTFAGGSLHSRFSDVDETAPMNIPQAGGGRGPLHHRNMSEPTRVYMFHPPSPKSMRGEAGTQESPSGTSRSFRRTPGEGIRMGDLFANLPGSKIKDSREESGRFSGVFSSSGSPRHVFSRSSSRLSMQDDTNDADFPFVVDDIDSDSRPGSSGGKEMGDQAGSSSHKSQEAAVGYLVHLLKSARPLRDPSYSSHTSKAESIEAGSTSSSFMSRRTSDALEELEAFKEIRENLLSRSRSRLQDSVDKP